jgi:teichoic acid transport system ATP-binding protein
LAVGDALFVVKCVEKMREFQRSGKTIVFVSHDGMSVKAWCDRAIWMEAGTLRMTGTSEDVVTAYDSHAKLAVAERELLRAIE